MRFVCLGYLDETKWDALTEGERTALMEECFAYDDELRRGGHFVGGDALQSVRSAVTLRHRGGLVAVTDGPYAETKEQLGGYFIIEAPNIDAALSWAARCPGARDGTIEVRPVWEYSSEA